MNDEAVRGGWVWIHGSSFLIHQFVVNRSCKVGDAFWPRIATVARRFEGRRVDEASQLNYYFARILPFELRGRWLNGRNGGPGSWSSLRICLNEWLIEASMKPISG